MSTCTPYNSAVALVPPTPAGGASVGGADTASAGATPTLLVSFMRYDPDPAKRSAMLAVWPNAGWLIGDRTTTTSVPPQLRGGREDENDIVDLCGKPETAAATPLDTETLDSLLL